MQRSSSILVRIPDGAVLWLPTAAVQPPQYFILSQTVYPVNRRFSVSDNSKKTTDDEEASPFVQEGERDIVLSDRPYDVYGCQTCDNVILSLHGCGEGMTCHNEEMVPVTEAKMDIKPPNLRDVLLNVFGLPKVGLDICLCVIDDGPLSPEEVAQQLGYDQSTIRRYLNQLTEIGLLTKMQLNREDGGFVNVYQPIDLEEMRRESLIGFYLWAGEAATLIEDANLTKEDYVDGSYAGDLNEVFWESFRGADTEAE
jgi:predicted transcriptional regulator